MGGARRIWAIGLVAAALLAAAAPSAAQEETRPGPAYQVIVNPRNPTEAVDREFLRNAFLKKVATWRNNETIRPVDLTRRAPLRDRFAREVLKKTPTQLKSYWNRLIFSGKAVPPPELASEEAVIAYVLANRGAIGYLSAGSNPRGAKVVRLK